MKSLPLPTALLGAGLALVHPANADVILSTDFTGRTINGLVVSNIPWTTLGVEDPGDLTAISEPPGVIPQMHDTANAQGHFAPDRNTGNEGPWSVDVPLVLAPGVSSITLESVELDWQHFNNSGNFQPVNRNVDWTVTVTGSASGLLATVTAPNVAGMSGIETLTFATPLVLTSTETYRLNINATGSNTTGNNTGLDALTVSGTVGPSGIGFAITEFGIVGDVITLTWNSSQNVNYAIKYSRDLTDWTGELDDSVPGEPGEQTTREFDLSEHGINPDDFDELFFRVEHGGG